jgi:hypothetical protein
MCAPRWITGRRDMTVNIGNQDDGVLQDYFIIEQEGLVAMPNNYDYVQASTLACAGVTSWNALYGLKSKVVMPGDWVLTEGTGGVSLFAIQVSCSIRSECHANRLVRESCGGTSRRHNFVRRQGQDSSQSRCRPCHQLPYSLELGRAGSQTHPERGWV